MDGCFLAALALGTIQADSIKGESRSGLEATKMPCNKVGCRCRGGTVVLSPSPYEEAGTDAFPGAFVTREEERTAVAKRRLDGYFVDDPPAFQAGVSAAPEDPRLSPAFKRRAEGGFGESSTNAVAASGAVAGASVGASVLNPKSATAAPTFDLQELLVEADDEITSIPSSVVPLRFSDDVKELPEDARELLTFFDDVRTRLEELRTKVDMAMDEEQQIFPGVLPGHTLSTRDGSVPTAKQMLQLRRAYRLKGSWIVLHARLYTAMRMLSESQATVKECTSTMGSLSRVYSKELVVTGPGHGVEVAVVQEGSLRYARF